MNCSERLVTVMAGARPSVLRGELINENCREEPVCLKCSEGLVAMNNRSSSGCVEGRALQLEL